MSIDAINNTGINTGAWSNSLSDLKPAVDSSTSDQETYAVENKEIKDVELMSAEANENFSENNEEQQKNLNDAIEKLNEAANIFHRSLKFSIHEATHRTMISVVDTDHNKVIREIPGEEALDMVAKMRDYLGMIFDKEA